MPPVKSLTDMCASILAQHVSRIDDVGDLSDHLLVAILARASPADLARIENNTKRAHGRDISYVTEPIWTKHLERATVGVMKPDCSGDRYPCVLRIGDAWYEGNETCTGTEVDLTKARRFGSAREAFQHEQSMRRRRREEVASKLRGAYGDEAKRKESRAVSVVHLAPKASKKGGSAPVHRALTPAAAKRLRSAAVPQQLGTSGNGAAIPTDEGGRGSTGTLGAKSASTRERLAARLGMGRAFVGRGGVRAAASAAVATRHVDRETLVMTTTFRNARGNVVTRTTTPAGSAGKRKEKGGGGGGGGEKTRRRLSETEGRAVVLRECDL